MEVIINLCPQRSEAALVVTKAGDVLDINGEPFDFSVIPDGATIPADDVACYFVIGEVSREAGQIVLTMLFPHGPNPPPHVAFPAPLVDVPDGPVVFPVSE